MPSPEREAHPSDRSERWCYRQVSGPAGGSYIYNADQEKVRPEMALLRTSQGMINQGSLGAGVVRYLSVPYRKFNPFSVPLEEPRGRHPVPTPLSAAFNESADTVLALLQTAKPEESAITTEGRFSASASYRPWRGFWWPYKGLPMVRPLSKLDSYARSRDGGSSAAAWESSHHASHGIWWEGHCNGWAAAAILRPEPRSIRVDDASGESFRVSDLKGLVSEADYCAPSAFFGYRNNDSSGVSPSDFHQALLHYIGQLHKPIAFNVDNNGPVDNRVISSYEMSMDRSGDGYVVTTTIHFHYYDSSLSDAVGTAPMTSKTYRYTLVSGNDNEIAAGGTWLSDHPGFVWVPLSTGGRCREGNPKVNSSYVDALAR
ncbi:MAG: hypothetical protein ACXVCI_07855 [Bdellovibrionota bacterium]